jgi:hypothetical protein
MDPVAQQVMAQRQGKAGTRGARGEDADTGGGGAQQEQGGLYSYSCISTFFNHDDIDAPVSNKWQGQEI